MAMTFATRYRFWTVIAASLPRRPWCTCSPSLSAPWSGVRCLPAPINVLAGLAFLGFGLWTLRGDELSDEEEAKAERSRARHGHSDRNAQGTLARPRTHDGWAVDGPQFPMSEVPAVARIDGPSGPRLLVGTMSPHWGPTVAWSDDLGEHVAGDRGRRHPLRARRRRDARSASGSCSPTRVEPGVVWAGCEPTSLWRSTDGGETSRSCASLWDHPHRPQWAPGFGGAAVHTIVPREGDDHRQSR